ncbi:CPBP family intramembrane glutamic endopeptidase [Parasynechococcus sp.]|uniref:CPBP family intramembrane glutamic endopeptidase n=1 Tax=Parasynechococcus sp. TaxID=3101203 RepID=UPI0037046271
MQQPLNRFLLLQPAWLPTVLFIPLLYALGWFTSIPLTLVGLPADQVSLTGTVLSFVLFLLVMPRWAALRWSAARSWVALGICRANPQEQPAPAAALLRGLLIAAGLLTVITSIVLIQGSGDWRGEVDGTHLANAVLLCLGVGLAEELIFRSWLWAELNRIMGSRAGALAQACIFSLVHTRFNLGLAAMSGLLVGLFLLGIVLAKQRQADRGSLWGCIGLHGGLVAGWFLLQNGLLQLSTNVPWWLVGPGGDSPNPLGGLVGLISVLILMLIQRTAVAKAARPATGARNAS